MRRGGEPAKGPQWGRRIAWLVAIWMLSVAALALAALALKGIMKLAGLTG